MIPIGYSRKIIGMFLAVAICIGAGVLMASGFVDVHYSSNGEYWIELV